MDKDNSLIVQLEERSEKLSQHVRDLLSKNLQLENQVRVLKARHAEIVLAESKAPVQATRSLTFEQYSKERMLKQPYFPLKEGLAMGSLGLAGETGEVVEHVKKNLFHDKPLNCEYLLTELGDVLWYVTWLAHVCGFSLQDVAEMNNKKLNTRYPNGFSAKTAAEVASEREGADG